MKLKRFRGVDIKQAINKVRAELGSDAVILSNRKTAKGVEIIAAVDYDEAALEVTEQESDDWSEEEGAKSAVTSPNTQMASFINDPKVSFDNEEEEPFWKKIMAESYSPVDKNQERESLKNDRYVTNKSAELAKRRLAQSYQSGCVQPENNPSKASALKSSFSANHKNQRMSDRNKIPVDENFDEIFSKDEVFNENSSDTSTDSLHDVWKELNDLRGLLEKQLSSLAWGDLSRRFPQRAQVLRRLIELGLSPAVSRRLLKGVSEVDNFDSAWKAALTHLAKQLHVMEDVFLETGGVFALVGPTGVGKTTTLAKIAARFVLRYGASHIALVTTDSFRIGAQEQLRTYGRILGVSVRIANDAGELKKVLKSLHEKKLILIDTAGISQRDIRLTEQFAMLSEGSPLIKTFLVLSVASQITVMDEAVRAYQKVMLDGCILTKLDEASLLGGALSILYHHKLPLAFLSDGQRVPEDLHNVRAVELLKRAINMMHKGNYHVADEELELAFGSVMDDID